MPNGSRSTEATVIEKMSTSGVVIANISLWLKREEPQSL